MYKVTDSIKGVLQKQNLPHPLYNADLKMITAEYLIRHIDRCFEVKSQVPWENDISFDTFCKYILPYRITNSYWADSRIYFNKKYNLLFDSLYSSLAISKHIDKDITDGFITSFTFFNTDNPFLHPITFQNLVKSRFGMCTDACSNSIEALRSMHIPSVLNHLPSWGNSDYSHTLTEILVDSIHKIYDNTQRRYTKPEDELITDMFWPKGVIHTFEGIPSQVNINFCRTVPKIYRECYALQWESLAFQTANEAIPSFFKNPNLEDVTSRYIESSDVTVSMYETVSNKFAYLCCYSLDRRILVPVAWAAIKNHQAVFRDMGINVLYFPACYVNGQMIPASTPFILQKNGDRKCFPVQPDMRDSVVLYSKTPYRSIILQFANAMIGGRFQVANRSDLSDTATIHRVITVPFYEHTVKIEDAPATRYAIYQFGGLADGFIAEMTFWGLDEKGEEVKLNGKIIGNPGIYKNEREKAMDDDRVSYFFPQKGKETYVGFDFGIPRKITRITYNPRSDDNGIVPGELYELFYWDNAWISLGKQEGRYDYTLVYTNVPGDVLLNLHNHTRGKENRPFTYENGKQVFW
jgi:hypothetical protein